MQPKMWGGGGGGEGGQGLPAPNFNQLQVETGHQQKNNL
jgi:hypothetical protein